jgi:hypothetical protein
VQRRHPRVAPVDLLELRWLETREDAIDAVLLEECETLSAVPVLVLEESDLVGRAAAQVVADRLIEHVDPGPEERVMQDERLDGGIGELVRQSEVRVDCDDRKTRVAAKGGDVLIDRRRVLVPVLGWPVVEQDDCHADLRTIRPSAARSS